MIRFGRAFLRFWSDFLIGDRLELFIGPVVALIVAALLVRADVSSAVVGVLFFASIALIGAFSVGLATRR